MMKKESLTSTCLVSFRDIKHRSVKFSVVQSHCTFNLHVTEEDAELGDEEDQFDDDDGEMVSF